MEDTFTLIDNTKDTYETLLKLITRATKSIDVQFFTFEGDDTGLGVAQALIQKAKEGLRVQVMIDDFSNWKVSDRWLFTLRRSGKYIPVLLEWLETQKMMRDMRNAGINLVITNPMNFWKPRKTLVSRCHKKLVIIDDKMALTGGFNLSDHNYAWHDTFTLITDPITIHALKEIFIDKFLHNKTKRQPILLPHTEIYQYTKPLMRRLRELVRTAQKHIFIESPYFIDKKIIKMMNKKSKQGIDVKLIVPEHNNVWYTHWIHKKYNTKYPHLIFFRKSPHPMTHAKHALIDNHAICGSSNFLNQFLIDNHEELSLILDNDSYAAQLEAYFRQSINTTV